VIVELLGVPPADRGRFTDWSDALTEFIGGALNVENRRRRAQVALEELSEYLGRAVTLRRRDGGDDLLAALIHVSRDGDSLSDEEVIATAAMLLFAGHGTTTNLVGNGMLALLDAPEALTWLADNPGACVDAVEEFLRYDSSVQITVRNAKHDGVLGLDEIAAGDRVFLFVGAANRDPSRFADPESLVLTRADKGHLSFGFGIHFCLGAPLARIEGPIAFRRLLTRFTDLSLQATELAWQPTVGFRGLQQLPISFRER
jgi:cytochrome P450